MRALLAYDGSAGAQEAAAFVLARRWPRGSSIRVVGVIELAAALVPVSPVAPGRLVPAPEVEAQITDYVQSEVESVVGRLRAQLADVEVEGAVLRGRPATVLVDEARSFAADLIVVGSRGHGAIASLLLGSVSAELVDHAPCPVLVARRAEAKRVLFASDGSPSAARAEQLLATWPILEDATIRVLSVAEVVRPWHTGIAPTMYRQVAEAYAEDLEASKSGHEAIARAAADRLAAAGRTAEARLREGEPAAEIIDEAATWPADLVVLGSRGLTGLSRIVLGSVARNVLQGTRSSVLVVRDAEATER